MIDRDPQPAVHVGDTVSMSVPVRRKRWHFWRPYIIGWERKTFIITATTETSPMTAFKSPADAALAIAEERRLYRTMKEEAELDVRLAKRDGDEAAVAVAEKAAADAQAAWYDAFKAAQTGIKATLETLGLDPAAIKMYL